MRRCLRSFVGAVTVVVVGCSGPAPAVTRTPDGGGDATLTASDLGAGLDGNPGTDLGPRIDATATAPPPSAVWTNRNDNARTGATLVETRLRADNVSAAHFGLLFTRAVQGEVYAQPLYMPGVTIPGHGTHNVVFVATEHNMVYAFDATDPAAAAPYWSVNLGPSVPLIDLQDQGACINMQIEVGITATPVIDVASNTLYVVAKTKEGGQYFQRLHALDLATGQERAGSPAVITAAIPGSGDGSKNGMLAFDPFRENNRPGLLLSRGLVYLAFASHCDREPYHGWVLAYNAATLRPAGAWADTANGTEGGIWQSGTGLSADDAGDVYFTSGNGTTAADPAAPQLANSIGRLHLAGGAFTVVDWFAPHDFAAMSANDFDLGSTGVLLMPGTNLAVAGSKEGLVYVLDRGHMGHVNAADDSQIVQSFRGTHTGETRNIHGAPVYWNSPAGPRVYIWGEEDVLKSFSFDGHLFNVTPARGTVMAANGMPGGILSVSAHGSEHGSGIVWSAMPIDHDANEADVPGVLRAVDAEDVTHELWNSEQDPRDAVGIFAKFCPPTVADGRVYLATFSGRLDVYGAR